MTENQQLFLCAIYFFGVGWRAGQGVFIAPLLLDMGPGIIRRPMFLITFIPTVLLWPVITGIKLCVLCYMKWAERKVEEK